MKLVNIAVQERANDNDFFIVGISDKGEVKGFILSRPLLQYLKVSIDVLLTTKRTGAE